MLNEYIVNIVCDSNSKHDLKAIAKRIIKGYFELIFFIHHITNFMNRTAILLCKTA